METEGLRVASFKVPKRAPHLLQVIDTIKLRVSHVMVTGHGSDLVFTASGILGMCLVAKQKL